MTIHCYILIFSYSVTATEKDREGNKVMIGTSVSDTKEFKLPEIINSYIEVSNRQDVKSILTCFTEDAVVYDKKAIHTGKDAIYRWVTETIQKYKFQFKPITITDNGLENLVVIERYLERLMEVQ